mmetsp:Transcript_67919/g.189670  ORF Transcript_67919/g.189670 Transcript_67919/m.189670 type:complete len:461 (+) Transcript_67919:221-1603(+)
MLTWRCLIAALKAQDRREIEVWLEQARGLGLDVPAGLPAILSEIREREDRHMEAFERRSETKQRLAFAMEIGDLELLEEVAAEAEALGLDASSARLAAARIRGLEPSLEQTSFPSGAAEAERPISRASRMSGTSRASRTGRARTSAASEGCHSEENPSERQRTDQVTAVDPECATGKDVPQEANDADRTTQVGNTQGPETQKDTTGAVGPATPDGGIQGSSQAATEKGAKQEPPMSTEQPRPVSNPSPEVTANDAPRAPEKTPVRELLQECRRRGLDTSRCCDREDLERLLHDGQTETLPRARAAAVSPPPRAQSPPKTHPSPRPPSTHAPSPRATSPAPPPAPPAPSAAPQAPPGEPPPRIGMQGGANSIWDRQEVPDYITSRRCQALWLLGLDHGDGKRPKGWVTATALRSAYRRAAMESHPDRHQNHMRQQEAKVLFQKVKNAFDFLNSPVGGVVRG